MSTEEQMRAAAYLVAGEIKNAREAATFILHGEPFTALPVDAWQQARLMLAEGLDWDEWRSLAHVYTRIHAYNWRVQADVLESSGQKERVLTELLDAAAAADAAIGHLGELAGAA